MKSKEKSEETKERGVKTMKNKQKGITLIALVITIIVLLILTGVTIATLTGENGILTQATKAGEETERATEEEQRQLTISEAAMSFENREYIDKNGDKAIIPSGFAVSEVEGENTVADGLVIIDSKGNEFVWIPCDGKTLTYQKHTYSGITDDTNLVVDVDHWRTYYYRKFTDWTDTGGNLNSVQNNKGFYIARYEAGLPEEPIEGTYHSEADNNISNGIPVSKKGRAGWNLVSQKNAIKLSANMYSNNQYVTSQLVDGYAWDTICNLLNSKYGGNGFIINSSSWGNYSNTSFQINGLYAVHSSENGVWNFGKSFTIPDPRENRYELTTGITDRNKAYNIYDFAGNLYEWSTEVGDWSETETKATNGAYGVIRGGAFSNNGAYCPACYRGGHDSSEDAIYNTIGFRVVLYLK